MLPDNTERKPVITSNSSVCPFPATPAMPRTSPSFTSSDTFFSALCPWSLTAFTWCKDKRADVAEWLSRATCRTTFAPTINSASSAEEVSLVLRFATILPPRITVTSSVVAIISWSLCVTKRTVFPCSFKSFTSSNNWSHSWGVKTAVGSSKIKISAPL